MTVCIPETETPARRVDRVQPPVVERAAPKPTKLPTPSATEHVGAGWTMAGSLIVICATLLRLYNLSLRPLHNDEGVNGFFLMRLFHDGVYRYDPANYHGPTLYYFAYAIACVREWLVGDGLSTWAVRVGPVLFGIGIIVLALKLWPEIGRVGALSAAASLAVSPGAVYFSRDFIHESGFVFFTLGVVLGFQRYRSTHRASWLLGSAISAGLLFATKETAAISVIVLLLAAVLSAGWAAYRPAEKRSAPPHEGRGRSRTRALAIWTVAAAVFVAVNAIFYSSFGSNPAGLRDALRAFTFWTKTAAKDQQYPWYTYAAWLAREETCVFALAIAGGALALIKATSRFAIFAALWSFGLLAAYSLVPYKTPWLMLNFVVPMALTGGWAVNFVYARARTAMGRRLVFTIASALLCLSAYQSVRLNFYEYDDPAHPYVYVQTRRGFLHLIEDVDRLAASTGTGRETSIAVLSRDYWPLPWYLRNYAHAAYPGRGVPAQQTLVITSGVQRRLLGPAFRGYDQVGVYPSRPGVDLVLLIKRAEHPTATGAAADPTLQWPRSKANPGSGSGE